MKSIALVTILILATSLLGLLPANAANQASADKEAIFSNAKAFVDALGFHPGAFAAGYASGVYNSQQYQPFQEVRW